MAFDQQHVCYISTCFFNIADLYAVPFDDLLAANQQFKGDFLALKYKDVLFIPEARGARTLYTVRAGDSLWKVSQLTGTPLSVMKEDNAFLDGIDGDSTSDMMKHVGVTIFIRPGNPTYKVEFGPEEGDLLTNLPLSLQEDQGLWARIKYEVTLQRHKCISCRNIQKLCGPSWEVLIEIKRTSAASAGDIRKKE